MNSPNVVNMIGRTYGRLTVIERSSNDKQGNAQWLCRCECGRQKVVRGGSLRQGRIRSCGCLLSESSKDRMSALVTKHGMRGAKLYGVYSSMIERCSSPKCKGFHNYGGRGIAVCDEWKDNRQSFFDWAFENGYEEGLQLDRIDNNGNYCPENCRWVTRKVNCNNTRKNVSLEYNGETHTLSEWADILCINRSTIFSRHRAGKPVDEILKKR